jgi:hypothetical protein
MLVVLAAALAAGCRCPEKKEGAAPPGPAGAQAADEQPRPDAEGWESLFDGKTLGKWKPADFWKPGEVHVVDGNLVFETGTGDMTGVFWGGDAAMLPRIDYEVALEAQRVEGGDFFCGLTFPYKDSCASLVVGGWGGGVIGISSLGGFDASENETTNYKEFENGRWYRIRLRVTDGRIKAWIDDEQVVDCEVGEREVDIRIEMEACKPFGLAAWNTKAALRNIRLRRLLDE